MVVVTAVLVLEVEEALVVILVMEVLAQMVHMVALALVVLVQVAAEEEAGLVMDVLASAHLYGIQVLVEAAV
jgi:hypothetical protein